MRLPGDLGSAWIEQSRRPADEVTPPAGTDGISVARAGCGLLGPPDPAAAAGAVADFAVVSAGAQATIAVSVEPDAATAKSMVDAFLAGPAPGCLQAALTAAGGTATVDQLPPPTGVDAGGHVRLTIPFDASILAVDLVAVQQGRGFVLFQFYERRIALDDRMLQRLTDALVADVGPALAETD